VENIIVRTAVIFLSLVLFGFGIYLAGEEEFLLMAILITCGLLLVVLSLLDPLKIGGKIVSLVDSRQMWPGYSKSEKHLAVTLSNDELTPDEAVRATALYEEVITRSEDSCSPEDFLLRATQEWRKGRNDLAVEDVFKGLNMNPKDTMVRAALLNRLGTIYEKLGKMDWALKKYTEACLVNDAYPWSYFNIANVYLLNLSDYEKAEEIYKIAVQFDPENPFVRNNLGVLYRRLEKYAAAESEYREAIRIYPSFTKAYFNLGLLYQVQEKFDDAEKAFKNALNLSPKDPRILVNVQNLQKRN